MAGLIPSVSENNRGLLEADDFFGRGHSALNANSDFNDYTYPGIYDINGVMDTTKNSPFTNSLNASFGMLVVFAVRTSGRIAQIAFECPNAITFVRTRTSSGKVWDKWMQL